MFRISLLVVLILYRGRSLCICFDQCKDKLNEVTPSENLEGVINGTDLIYEDVRTDDERANKECDVEERMATRQTIASKRVE